MSKRSSTGLVRLLIREGTENLKARVMELQGIVGEDGTGSFTAYNVFPVMCFYCRGDI